MTSSLRSATGAAAAGNRHSPLASTAPIGNSPRSLNPGPAGPSPPRALQVGGRSLRGERTPDGAGRGPRQPPCAQQRKPRRGTAAKAPAGPVGRMGPDPLPLPQLKPWSGWVRKAQATTAQGRLETPHPELKPNRTSRNHRTHPLPARGASGTFARPSAPPLVPPAQLGPALPSLAPPRPIGMRDSREQTGSSRS